MERRIGIMGGTFDPIHMGHLITAEMVRSAAPLDAVLFVLAACPPHKDAAHAASMQDRLAMTEYGVRENPHFFVSDIELRREGPVYHLYQAARNLIETLLTTKIPCYQTINTSRE